MSLMRSHADPELQTSVKYEYIDRSIFAIHRIIRNTTPVETPCDKSAFIVNP